MMPNLNTTDTAATQEFASVADRLVNIIPFIDPDSTRFVEWMWSLRQAQGLGTTSDDYRLPSNTMYSLDEVTAKLKEEIPVHFSSPYYFRALTPMTARKDPLDGGVEVPAFYIVVAKNANGITFTAVGDEAEVARWMAYFRETFTEPAMIKINNLMGFSDSGPIVKVRQMQEDKQPLAHNEFYPWLEEGVDGFIKAYRESRSSILVLIGEPGTGKSTFLRTLLFRMKMENIGLANNEASLLNPGLISWMEDLGENSVIAIEDADNLVEARAEGNKQMSGLLNFADGVYSNGSKMVISTNLSSVNKMDSALVRPGRTYAIMKFEKLTPEQANAARASIDLPAIEFTDKVTLSEALNYSSATDLHTRQKVGGKF